MFSLKFNKFYVYLKYIIGVFYGIINRKTATFLNPFNGEAENLHSPITTKEDVLKTLKYFLCDGGVLRCNYVAPKTKYYASGGIQALMGDRKEQELKDCEWLKEKYPKMISKVKTKKNMFNYLQKEIYSILLRKRKHISTGQISYKTRYNELQEEKWEIIYLLPRRCTWDAYTRAF